MSWRTKTGWLPSRPCGARGPGGGAARRAEEARGRILATPVGKSLSSDDSFVFFQEEDGIRDVAVTGVQTCALPIFSPVSPRICSRPGSPTEALRILRSL